MDWPEPHLGGFLVALLGNFVLESVTTVKTCPQTFLVEDCSRTSLEDTQQRREEDECYCLYVNQYIPLPGKDVYVSLEKPEEEKILCNCLQRALFNWLYFT